MKLSLEQLSILADLASPFNSIASDGEDYMVLTARGFLQITERPAYSISPKGLRALADALAAGELELLMSINPQEEQKH